MDDVSCHYTKLAEQQRITFQIDVAVIDRDIKKLQHRKNKKKIIKGGGIVMAMGAVVLTAGLDLLDVLMVVDIRGTTVCGGTTKNKMTIIQGGVIVMAMGAMVTVSVLMAWLGLLGSLLEVDIGGIIGGRGTAVTTAHIFSCCCSNLRVSLMMFPSSIIQLFIVAFFFVH